MKLYEDEQELILAKSAGLTKEVHELVEKEKMRLLREEGRKVSRSKIVNNALIEVLCHTKKGQRNQKR